MNVLQVEYVKPETVETKFGQKTKYSIKDSNEKWYTCWDRGMSSIKQGDTITGTVSEREYNGKTYYDFKMMSPELVAVYKEMKKLGERIAKLEGKEEISNEVTDEDLSEIPFN